jgi:hypothetical protein
MLFFKKNFYLILTIFNILLFILFLNFDFNFSKVFYLSILSNLLMLLIYFFYSYLEISLNKNIVKNTNIFYLSDYRK